MPWCWSVCFWWGTSWPDQALWHRVPWGTWWWKGNVPFSCHWASVLSHGLSLPYSACSVVLWCNAALTYTSSWSPHGSCGGSNLWVMWSCFTTCQIYGRKIFFLFLFFFNGQTTFPHERGMKRRQGADTERMHRKGCAFIWGLKQISVHFRL